MMRKICTILFFLTVLFNSAYAGEIDLKAGLLNAPPSSFLTSSNQEDSQEVFDIWYQPESVLKYRKSTTKAAFLSLLLPGTGEYYAESKRKAHIFLGTDAVLWIGFLGLRSYGSWLKKDYRTYAASRAGVDLNGKEDEFFEDLTYYQSRDEYNQFAPLYSNGELSPYPQTDFWDWQWDNTSSRYHYRHLRNRSKSAYRKSIYMVGLLVANRIISAIDAIKAVKGYNRKRSLEISSVKIDIKANPFSSSPHFELTLTKSF